MALYISRIQAVLNIYQLHIVVYKYRLTAYFSSVSISWWLAFRSLIVLFCSNFVGHIFQSNKIDIPLNDILLFKVHANLHS